MTIPASSGQLSFGFASNRLVFTSANFFLQDSVAVSASCLQPLVALLMGWTAPSTKLA
jgi:hypothetical protein